MNVDDRIRAFVECPIILGLAYTVALFLVLVWASS